MGSEKLTLQSVQARPVLVPLERPIVSKVGLFEQWPLILIDLYTEEGKKKGQQHAPELVDGPPTLAEKVVEG